MSFAYPSNPDTTVLNKSSFFFPSGEMTFIVGRSGSGKSTLGNLLVRFYHPKTGEIKIDGHPLRALDKRWLRENVTLIQQSSILFNDSFFQNIALGHLHPDRVTQEDFNTAVDASLLRSTLSTLPDGHDTKVGPGGYNLSGGQKQRVALARARIRDSPVLILDEISSGLDQVSRDLIMDALRKWRYGKTTIIITHDVSQITDDDFVYVMDSASLVEEGFKRDLAQNETGALASLLASATTDQDDQPDTPIEINVISPYSPYYSRSPLAPPPLARSLRVSRIFVDELEDLRRHSFLAPGAAVSPRISWGTSSFTAFGLGSESARNSGVYSPNSGIYPQNPGSYSQNSGLYLQGSGAYPQKLLMPRSPPLLRERPIMAFKRQSLADYGEKRLSELTEGSTFVFGEADRRDNIGSLRSPVQDKTLDFATVEAAVTPSSVSVPSEDDRISLVAIIKTVWPTLEPRHRIILILGTIVCVVGAGAIPTFGYCFAQLLGVMWSPGDKIAEGRSWAIYLFVVAVIDGACTGGGRYLFEVVAQAWINAIRVQALEKILRQRKTWFDKPQNSPGRINECLDRNAEEMRNIVGKFISIMIVVTLMILIAVAWALALSWKLTLVAMALGPVVMGAVKSFSVISGKCEASCNQGAEDSSAALTEIFLNIRVVRSLTQEDYFTSKYAQSIAHTLSLGIKRALYTCLPYGLYQSLNYHLTALVFYYGTVLLARDKEIDATSVVQVVNLLLFSVGTATSFLSAMPQITMAQATASQMLGYINMPTKPDSHSGSGAVYSPTTPLPVKLNELNFAYKTEGRRAVLQGVSFDINPRNCLAIVGRSGCGKSTVVSLVLGLYSPSERSVLGTVSPLTFARCAYTDVDMEHIRSMMAYVPQAPFLFPATIAENIAYGMTESSPLRRRENLTLAARAAGLHDFIASLPEGYDTLVGDGGQTLSGGQAQRLSIARALARKPALLVLDEPTSALDAESAEMIRQTIQELVERSKQTSAGMAIVVVTHSREMMAIADRIVMLEEGVKVEEGSYQGLMAKRGKFAELVSGGGGLKGRDEGDRGERDEGEGRGHRKGIPVPQLMDPPRKMIQ